MPIAVKAVLAKCNFNCSYCFQTPESRVDEFNKGDYDLKAILKTMEDLHKKCPNQDIVIHGGECTAYPREDLEAMLKKSYELSLQTEIYKAQSDVMKRLSRKYSNKQIPKDIYETSMFKTYEIEGKTAIQTNGWKIDEYFDLFKKYRTSLGVSFDGLGEANLLRGFGSKEQRLEQATKIEENVFKAIEEKIPVSIIAIITKQNGIKHIDKLKELLLKLRDKGVTEGRLNPCTVTDNIADKPKYELSIDEMVKVYNDLFEFCMKHGLSYSPFKDIAASLRGDSNVVCVFRGCDYYATPSLIAILGDGSVGNCIKTYRSEEPYLRDNQTNIKIRRQLLKETDCKDCKWFEFCNGGCPNDGIGGDWRRKTKYCALYKHLFEKINNIQQSFGIRKRCVSNRDDSKMDSRARHEDGSILHLDSDLAKGHSDGAWHTDGNLEHGDG